MRDSCADCVRKHISQAFILANILYLYNREIVFSNEIGQAQLLMDEFATGDYPLHMWFAIGHIAVLENAYIYKKNFEEAKELRKIRIKIMEEDDYFFISSDISNKNILNKEIIVQYTEEELIQRIRGHILEAVDESIKEFPSVTENILFEYYKVCKKSKDWSLFDHNSIIELMGTEYDLKYPIE